MKPQSTISLLINRIFIIIFVVAGDILVPRMALCGERTQCVTETPSGLAFVPDSLVRDTLHYGGFSIAIQYPPRFVARTYRRPTGTDGLTKTTAIIDSVRLSDDHIESFYKGVRPKEPFYRAEILVFIFSDRNTVMEIDGEVTDEEMISGKYIDRRGYKIENNERLHSRIIVIPAYSLHLVYRNVTDDELYIFDKIFNNIKVY